MKIKFTFYLTTLVVLGSCIKMNAQLGCTFTGQYAGENSIGNNNTGTGAYALTQNIGSCNSGFGANSLKVSTGGFNCAFGSEAMKSNTTGELNVALGTRTMENNTAGSKNIAVGHRSLGANTAGSMNTAVGYGALSSAEGTGNVALGFYTPRHLIAGDYNTFVGTDTGSNLSNGSYNLFLGRVSLADAPSEPALAGNNTNSTIILADGRGYQKLFISPNGNVGIGLGNNVVPTNRMDISGGVAIGKDYTSKGYPLATLGAVAPTNGLLVQGNVGIGNTVPKNKVEITQGTDGNSGLRFTNLTSNYTPPATQGNNKCLSVNAQGDVILQNIPSATYSNTLTSTGNTLTSSVNNVVAAAPIINTITNTLTSDNQLITTVNGVASQPITLPVGTGSSAPQVLTQTENTITLSNGGGSFTLPTFVDTDTDAQTLALNGNILAISNGNSVVLPNAAPQTLTQSGNTITLSNGGGSFTLPTFVDTNTDAQTLTLTGNTLAISNGNTVTLPSTTTSIVAGNNTTITGNGSAATPYVINAVDKSIYSVNGTINASNTVNGNRVVNMNGSNIWFKSTTTDANGKLYIGTNATYPSTTGNYRLFVEGGIMTEKVKVSLRSSANWADYVFADNYKLMPLKEVASYVSANKHLPGVDSAKDLAENGLDLATMQSKQMEKIEELTLYIIDQDKKIEAQNKALENTTNELEALKLQVKALIEKTK